KHRLTEQRLVIVQVASSKIEDGARTVQRREARVRARRAQIARRCEGKGPGSRPRGVRDGRGIRSAQLTDRRPQQQRCKNEDKKQAKRSLASAAGTQGLSGKIFLTIIGDAFPQYRLSYPHRYQYVDNSFA